MSWPVKGRHVTALDVYTHVREHAIVGTYEPLFTVLIKSLSYNYSAW